MYYPFLPSFSPTENTYLTPSFFFLSEQTINANISKIRAQLQDLQTHQYCLNQTESLNMMGLFNHIPSQSCTIHKEKRKDWIYELDRIIFPDNPIRDYIEAEVKKIKEKYAKRIEQLNALLA